MAKAAFEENLVNRILNSMHIKKTVPAVGNKRDP